MFNYLFKEHPSATSPASLLLRTLYFVLTSYPTSTSLSDSTHLFPIAEHLPHVTAGYPFGCWANLSCRLTSIVIVAIPGRVSVLAHAGT